MQNHNAYSTFLFLPGAWPANLLVMCLFGTWPPDVLLFPAFSAPGSDLGLGEWGLRPGAKGLQAGAWGGQVQTMQQIATNLLVPGLTLSVPDPR